MILRKGKDVLKIRRERLLSSKPKPSLGGSMGKKGGKLLQALGSHTARQQSKAKEAVAQAAREAKLASIGKGKGKAERKDLAEKKVKKLDQQALTVTATSQAKGKSCLDKYRKGKGKEKEKEAEVDDEEEEVRFKQDGIAVSTSLPESKPTIQSRTKSKTVRPFQPEDTILLIGEGNFSFTLSLISSNPKDPSKYTHDPSLILSTAYDTEAQCYSKYPDAKSNVEKIRKLAARQDVVVFGVDAGELNKCRDVTGRKKGEKEDRFKQRRWSKVWFGFPHNGSGHKDQRRNVLSNQLLLLRFFVSVAPFLTTGDLPKYVSSSKNTKKRDLDDLEGASDDDEEVVDDTETNEKETGALETLEKGQEDEDNPELDQVIKEGLLTSSIEIEKPTQSQTPLPTVSNQFKPPRKRGSILVTLRNASPYTLWDISHLATRLTSLLPSISKSAPSLPKGQTIPTFQETQKAFSYNAEISSNSYSEDQSSSSSPLDANNYRLWRSFEFDPKDWNGYSHRRTTGWIEGVSTSNNEDILRGAPREGQGQTSGGSVRNESNMNGNGKASKSGGGECRTWEFGLNLVGDDPVGGTGAKRGFNSSKRAGKSGPNKRPKS